MSDNDFTIIDAEETAEEKKEVQSAQTEEDKESEYEKICFICHRPESVTGSMMSLPNNITVCKDCMQKSFDTINDKASQFMDFSKFPNINFSQLLQEALKSQLEILN